MFKALTVVAVIQSMVNQAMPQSNCDVIKIAEDYVRIRWPFIDITNRRPSRMIDGDVWKVAFELPEDTLGYVPEVSIHQGTCQVIGAVVWQ